MCIRDRHSRIVLYLRAFRALVRLMNMECMDYKGYRHEEGIHGRTYYSHSYGIFVHITWSEIAKCMDSISVYQFPIFVFIALYDFRTVSYTHLDVYKRQSKDFIFEDI